jgi:hypothetical protein
VLRQAGDALLDVHEERRIALEIERDMQRRVFHAVQAELPAEARMLREHAAVDARAPRAGALHAHENVGRAVF